MSRYGATVKLNEDTYLTVLKNKSDLHGTDVLISLNEGMRVNRRASNRYHRTLLHCCPQIMRDPHRTMLLTLRSIAVLNP